MEALHMVWIYLKRFTEIALEQQWKLTETGRCDDNRCTFHVLANHVPFPISHIIRFDHIGRFLAYSRIPF